MSAGCLSGVIFKYRVGKGKIPGYLGSHPKSFQRLTIPIVQSMLSPPREKLSDLWCQTSDTAP
ncbi:MULTISPECIES: hypothetical protein, partial [unclassified Methanoculleus]